MGLCIGEPIFAKYSLLLPVLDNVGDKGPSLLLNIWSTVLHIMDDSDALNSSVPLSKHLSLFTTRFFFLLLLLLPSPRFSLSLSMLLLFRSLTNTFLTISIIVSL